MPSAKLPACTSRCGCHASIRPPPPLLPLAWIDAPRVWAQAVLKQDREHLKAVTDRVTAANVEDLKAIVDCILAEDSQFSLFARPVLQQV